VFGVESNEGRINFFQLKGLPVQTAVGGVDFDCAKEFGLKKFDVVVGNPPFQAGTNSKDYSSIYVKIINTVINNTQMWAFVLPQGWLKSQEREYLNFREKLFELGLHTIFDCSKVFEDQIKIRTCAVIGDIENTSNLKINSINISDRTLHKNGIFLFENEIEKNIAEKLIKYIKKNSHLSYVRGTSPGTSKIKNLKESDDGILFLSKVRISGKEIKKIKSIPGKTTLTQNWSVVTPYMPSGNSDLWFKLNVAEVIPPGVAVPSTYCIFNSDSEAEAETLKLWLKSDVITWILMRTRTSRHLDKHNLFFVPNQKFEKELSLNELNYIKNKIQKMK
jgi:hypothetical protein